ncbi:hypothetical protein CHLNCDRAFT_55359 [Chlorella variabilis]|uniref:Uncharacterized protein n=1 Tax=Chlorella variabilis TaxID=554065 RepID=E1ZSV0_CHLVA|nr:hypothetical protein CHLNCDRAFT_55359 [Chlorella variabilis]EFN51068.1 hypothetical protein CHLNCDRAFT_55359 [Chlorella variabilis]|eukprot:XP_005843170.1 hypothetical protein CHLNCDRAFT_55359 [Chlorella variabilis]
MGPGGAHVPDLTQAKCEHDAGSGARAVGKRWDVLGSAAGATAAKAHHHSLALDAADGGRPYLAALEGPGYNLTVRKYVSKEAGWQALPQPSGSGAAGYVALLMHPTQPGRPWVAYGDPSRGGRLSVRAFTGASWVAKGQPGLSQIPLSSVPPKLAFAPDGAAWIAFRVGSAEDGPPTGPFNIVVMKWLASSSSRGQRAAVSPAEAEDVQLAVGPNGEPYVAFRDMGDGNFPLSRGMVVRRVALAGGGFQWSPLGPPQQPYFTLAMEVGVLGVEWMQGGCFGVRRIGWRQ